MCYSGNCIWEDNCGDCRFPRNVKSVKEKYPDLIYLCPHGDETQEDKEWRIMIEQDIIDIIRKEKNNI